MSTTPEHQSDGRIPQDHPSRPKSRPQESDEVIEVNSDDEYVEPQPVAISDEESVDNNTRANSNNPDELTGQQLYDYFRRTVREPQASEDDSLALADTDHDYDYYNDESDNEIVDEMVQHLYGRDSVFAEAGRNYRVGNRPANSSFNNNVNFNNANVHDSNDNDDLVITQVNSGPNQRIRRMSDSENDTRNVRRRLDNEEDDIEIIDERPATSSLPLRPDTIDYNNMDSYRRSLVNRIEQNSEPGYVPNPRDLNTLMTQLHDIEERGNDARNRRSDIRRRRRQGRRPNNTPAGSVSYADNNYDNRFVPFRFINQIFDVIGLHAGGAADVVNQGSNMDQIEGSIMERIERDNEMALDERLENENRFNRSALLQKKDAIKREAFGYTNDIKNEETVCCELCAVVLGEGIPKDFTTNLQYDKNLQHYMNDYKVNAPWFCSHQLTGVDKDLSRRVFVAKCGHVYCGRCIKNISNRPRKKRKRGTIEMTMENPNIYAPSKCTGCDERFKGKKSFTELFF